MKEQNPTYKVLGQLTLSLAILSGSVYAESLISNPTNLLKGQKSILQNPSVIETSEVIPLNRENGINEIEGYELLLKEIKPSIDPEK